MSQPITDFSRTDIEAMSIDTGISSYEIRKFLCLFHSENLELEHVSSQEDWRGDAPDPDDGIEVHRARHQDRILWGTEHQHEVVRKEISTMVFLSELVDYYEDVPFGAFYERRLVLEEIASRFYQPSTGE